MNSARITLDQWSTLVAVVEAGGYAQAAEKLHKSQSTLTYAVQKLEHLLDLKVFEIKGRKAVLTPTGELLYRRGKALTDEAGRLEHAAGELARGWEPEIGIAAEIIFPTWLLLQCLAEFAKERPETRIELIESVLGGTEEALNERKVHIAITPVVPPGFVGDALMQLRFVCMAAPGHPLHQLGRPVTRSDLKRHRHLVVRDSGSARDRRGGWLNEQRWTVSNKATSIRAACMGLGYAWFPEESVREELAAGTLKPLPLSEGAERFATLYLVLADGDAAGPGTKRLAALIAARVKHECAGQAAALATESAPKPARSTARVQRRRHR